jgi:hypothetical protein
MGCMLCSQAFDGRLPIPGREPRRITVFDQLIDETSRRPLKIKKGNYVKIKEGSLSDFYDIVLKIGEGD